MAGENRPGLPDSSDRGLSPVVAVALLFTMVLIGAGLVFVTGSEMIAAFESNINNEKVDLCVDESDHRLGTVVGTGSERSLEFDDPNCQPQVAGDGSISVTAYNSSIEDPQWSDPDRTVTEELGALEFDANDRRIAHQGGGIFELTDSGARTVESPEIGFGRNDTLNLEFMQVSSGNGPGARSIAQQDPDGASQAAANLSSVVENATNDVAIKIESQYADGWERHLESEIEQVDTFAVDVDRPSNDEVVMTIEEIGEAPIDPHFLIDEDHGLSPHSNGHTIAGNILEHGTDFYINTTLTNYGDEADHVTATITIWNESGAVVETRQLTSNDEIAPGESIRTDGDYDWAWGGSNANHRFVTKSGNTGNGNGAGNGNQPIGVEPGETYEYQVETDPGDDSLTDRGSFLVDENPPEFSIEWTNVVGEPITPRETVTVEAEIENQGEEDTQYVWLGGFDGNVVDIGELHLDRHDSKTVTFEWGTAPIPSDSDPELTVGTQANTETVDVDVEPLLEITDVEVLEDSVEEGDTVSVEANLEALGGQTRQSVVLEGFDGGVVDRETVTVSGDRTITLDYPGVGERTDRVTVRTDDDEAEAVVVVEREGPVCREVSYDGSGTSSDPYQVGNVDQLQCINDQGLDAHYELVDDIDAHGTKFWNSGTTAIHEEAETDDGTDFTYGDRINLSKTSVVDGSVHVDGGGYYGTGPDFELVDPENGIIEIRDSPGYFDDWSELEITYERSSPQGFEPIGQDGNNYPNKNDISNWDGDAFSGEFDGNGNEIRGLYIDRPNERFVGLFGATNYPSNDAPVGWGSTIQNVRLTDVYVHGQQHVGALAGQAGGTVENARSEGYVEGEEQLVGGLIGDGAHANIDNRLVAEGTVVGGEIAVTGRNKLNHEGIGGLVGRATWETQVSTAYTQTDVSGSKYVGSIVGTSSYVDSEFEQMYTTGTASGSDSDAGAIVGHVLSGGDRFADSVYWDETIESDPYGEVGNWYRDRLDPSDIQGDWIGRTTAEMQGLDVTDPGRMDNLEYEDEGGPWVAIPEDYPRFAWELEAEGVFEVDIDDVENVTAGEAATVEVTVTSRYQDRNEEDVTQTITLTDPDGQIVDTKQVTLESSLDDDESTTIDLVWQTGFDDDGVGEVTVRSEDREDSATIEVDSVDDRTGNAGSSPEDIIADSAVDIDVDAVQVG
ncbi:DUF7289 family protein [Halopiger goleimassiliensis]|uniref:DUF7289 family protein n=1 Tax=Halopiger goleimassiliensis TaxID=1293048 RepID=UPI000677C6D6|nr:archaellin/type IV pilin N-terminal domain-containing protein [Halopiger goleimassiliensis]